MEGRLKLHRSCGNRRDGRRLWRAYIRRVGSMNSTHQRSGAFSCCLLGTLLFREYSSRLNAKTLKVCEKILVSHIHTAAATHLSILGRPHLAAGKPELTCPCFSLYTRYKSRSLWLSWLLHEHPEETHSGDGGGERHRIQKTLGTAQLWNCHATQCPHVFQSFVSEDEHTLTGNKCLLFSIILIRTVKLQWPLNHRCELFFLARKLGILFSNR